MKQVRIRRAKAVSRTAITVDIIYPKTAEREQEHIPVRRDSQRYRRFHSCWRERGELSSCLAEEMQVCKKTVAASKGHQQGAFIRRQHRIEQCRRDDCFVMPSAEEQWTRKNEAKQLSMGYEIVFFGAKDRGLAHCY